MIYIIFSLFSFIYSTTHFVPEEYSTIQAGIDVAVDGDTVLVNQGIYYENLHLTKSIVLTSYAIYDDLENWTEYSTIFGEWQVANDNINNTIIDGSTATDDYGSCVLIYSPSGDCISPEVIGFTLQNGIGTSVTFLDEGLCVEELCVEGNFGNCQNDSDCDYVYQNHLGGAILFDISNPIIEYNQFLDNGSSDVFSGGGIYATTLEEDWSFNNRDLNGRARCDIEEFEFQNNYYNGNDAVYGNTFANKYFENTIDMSGSVFDVANCQIEEVSTFWVHVEPIAEVYFENIESNLCAITASNIYVDSNIDQECIEEGCGTQQNPFKTITWTLSMIFPSEANPMTIHLSNGTYSPETGETFPIILPSYVTLQGEGENLTILDAMETNNVIFIENSNNTNISDLTITGGNVLGYGGGICMRNSNANLTNVSVVSNSAFRGGGVYIKYDAWLNTNNFLIEDPVFSNVSILNNNADYGGGMYLHCDELDDLISIENVSMVSNTSIHGGGIYITGYSSPILRNATITSNSASKGGGVYFHSMYIWLEENHHIPKIENSIINLNTANYDGGGIYSYQSNPKLEDVNILENYASRGGGLYIDENHPHLTNVIIASNIVNTNGNGYSYGGGIYLDPYSWMTLEKVLIHSNVADYGGGICSHDTSNSNYNWIKLINVTMASNFANQQYGAMRIYGYTLVQSVNTIIWHNGIEPLLISTVSGVYSNNSNIEGESFLGSYNIDSDPLFTNSENDDFSLQAESPCIDTGAWHWQSESNGEEYWIEDYFGYNPDMGALEWMPQAETGDVNWDGIINIIDIIAMVNLILINDYDYYADLNEDGIINIGDVIQIINIILDA